MTICMVEAVDWALYAEQISAKTQWRVIRGLLVGFLIEETADHIVLSPQLFPNDDGDDEVRCTLVVPRCCILKMNCVPFEQGAIDE